MFKSYHISYFETLQIHYFSKILIPIIQSQVGIYATYDIVLIIFPFFPFIYVLLKLFEFYPQIEINAIPGPTLSNYFFFIKSLYKFIDEFW